MTLHYQIDGPTSGKPLLLINGLFASLESWDPALKYLAEFRILRFDGKGQGKSPDPQQPYVLAEQLEDLTNLLNRLDWPETNVVGISNGGCLALALAARYPERVSALAVAGCTMGVSPLLRLKLQTWLQAHRIGGAQHRFDVATPWIWSNALIESQPDLINHYRSNAGERNVLAVEHLILGALQHEIDVSPITAPCLLLAGDQDILTPKWEMSLMLPLMKKARLEQVIGAHASLLEHPDLFEQKIVPFLRKTTHVA